MEPVNDHRKGATIGSGPHGNVRFRKFSLAVWDGQLAVDPTPDCPQVVFCVLCEGNLG